MWEDDQYFQYNALSDMVPLSGYIKKKSKLSSSACALISMGCLQCIHELNEVGLMQSDLRIDDFYLRRMEKVSFA